MTRKKTTRASTRTSRNSDSVHSLHVLVRLWCKQEPLNCARQPDGVFCSESVLSRPVATRSLDSQLHKDAANSGERWLYSAASIVTYEASCNQYDRVSRPHQSPPPTGLDVPRL